ncbi:MAG TPA: hypothetical protein VGO59_08320 [Verrucomicrobiae bacterium]|jgi:Tfp pilus assembly protein PilO
MNNFLSQLNLTPQERRVMVIIFLVMIFVLNLMFVWPHFGEWGKINNQLEEMRRTIANDNRAIQNDLAPATGTHALVVKYSQLEGGHVEEHAVDPQNQLDKTIRDEERKTGVYVQQFSPGSVKTNEFFEELSTAITVQTQESNLVNFLYNMGLDPAMIRVSRLDLQPADANRYALKGTITLTGNYAKSAPAAAAPAKPIPGTRPPPAAQARGNKPPAGPAAAPANKQIRLVPNAPGANRPRQGPPKSNLELPNRPMTKPNRAPAQPAVPQ